MRIAPECSAQCQHAKDIDMVEHGSCVDYCRYVDKPKSVVGHIGFKKQTTPGETPTGQRRTGRKNYTRKGNVTTLAGLRCYYRRDLSRSNRRGPIRLYFKDEQGHKQRLDIDDATTASWVRPGVYYTIEQIADDPKKKRR